MRMIPNDAHLIGYWPMVDDTNDHSPIGHTTKAVDVELGATGPDRKRGTAARFNGQSSLLGIADHPSLNVGTKDLTIACQCHISVSLRETQATKQ